MKQSITLAQMHLFKAEELEIQAEVLETEAEQFEICDIQNPPSIEHDLEVAERNVKAARLKKEAQLLRDRAEKHRSKAAAGNRREHIQRPKLFRI